MKRVPPKPSLCHGPLSAAILIATLFSFKPTAQAISRNFNVTDGNWGVNTNWVGSILPTADTAIIDGGRTARVTDVQSTLITNVGYTNTVGQNDLQITETGVLTQTGGAFLGYSAGTKGSATVAGSWTMTALTVGNSGTGSLTVMTTGTVSSGALSLGAGNGANGTLDIQGTMLNTTSSIANTAGSTAAVTVSGTWTSSSSLTWGNSGVGNVTIHSGGSASGVGTFNIGSQATGVGNVLTRGTISNTGGDLRIGSNGSGTLTIGAGGIVDINNGTGIVNLAFSPTGGSGVLNIGGTVNGVTPGATEAAGILKAAEVKGWASGKTSTLNFNHTSSDYYFTTTGTSGGTSILISGLTTTLNAYSGETVLTHANTYGGGTTVTGTNAKLVAANNTALGSAAAKVSSGGTLEIESGIILANAITLDGGALQLSGGRANGAIQLTGTGSRIVGNGTLGAALTMTSGNTLSAGGDGIGTLTFANSVTLAAGSVTQLDLNSLTNGEFDLLKSTTHGITLGGTLNIRFAEEFDIMGSATLFEFTALSGMFESIHFTGLADGYFASFDETSGMVTVIPEPSTWALLGLSATGWIIARRRNRA